MKKFIYILICLSVIIAMFSGCINTNQKGNATENSTEKINADIATDYIISTQYGELHYPDQWEDLINVEEKVEENSSTITFETIINEKTYKLFDVVISERNDNSIGKITDEKGVMHDVNIQTYDIPKDDMLTEGEQRRLYAMQEDLNYVIDNLN